MRKLVVREPIEYVMSEMRLVDERGSVAYGAVVSPRFEDDPDSRFEGEQGNLIIAISSSASTRVAAYEAAIAYFQELRKQELLKEELLRPITRKRKRKGSRG